ncbi:MAG TPA: hypothetical protein DCE04_08545, partial [Thermoanaerobacter sp.]|nr:hypothetical protein [Thermoanaerobacter sp.]
YEGLPLPIIIDGRIMHQNMQKAGIDMEWLNEQLKMWKIQNVKEVLFASLDTNKVLTVYRKEG